MRHALRALAVASALTLASPTHAAGVDPGAATSVQREQAQARFLRGRQLFDAKRFEEALAEFRASHEIVASPNSRLYLARALVQLGRDVEAYVELGRAEVEAREQARVDNRYVKAADAAADERSGLKGRLAFVTVRIQNAKPETRLVVAGEEIRRAGWAEPIPAKPGATEIRVESPGRAPATHVLSLTSGQTSELPVDVDTLAPAGDAAPTPARVDAPSSQGEAPTNLMPYAIAAGAVGVVGIAGFAIAGSMSKTTHDDLAARCPDGRCSTDPASDVSKGKSQQVIANVSLVVGALGLAAGGVLFFMQPKARPASAGVKPSLGLGHAGVSGWF